MKITHTVTINADSSAAKDFADAGIDIELGFVSFKITESDPRWQKVSQVVKKHRAVDLAYTSFSVKELKSSQDFVMRSTWHHGYPEPSDDFAYIEEVYEKIDYCEVCGVGLRQKNSFKMKGEPKWGTKGIMQMNWEFGDYFVKPDVWRDVFSPFGIESRAVLHRKSAKILDTVVQLIIPEVDISFNLKGYKNTKCPNCNRIKYLPITRGPIPSLESETSELIFRPENIFGDGGLQFKLVVVNHKIYEIIKRQKLKGVYFTPVAVP